ncbi:hypothetical protein ABIE76_004710 [Sinorhizobium fredii]
MADPANTNSRGDQIISSAGPGHYIIKDATGMVLGRFGSLDAARKALASLARVGSWSR